MSKDGTPKTLRMAIQNSIQESMSLEHSEGITVIPHPSQAILAEMHVRDFLAQRFGAAVMRNFEYPQVAEILMDLFQSITGEDRVQLPEEDKSAA